MPEMVRNHGNETAGAKTEDEPIPAWAKIYFHQQVRLLERMNSLVMDNSKPKQKKANVQCYKCGKYGHYARERRLSAPSQGNAKIPSAPQTVHTGTPEISKIGQCNGRQYNICKLSCKWVLRKDFVCNWGCRDHYARGFTCSSRYEGDTS